MKTRKNGRSHIQLKEIRDDEQTQRGEMNGRKSDEYKAERDEQRKICGRKDKNKEEK